MYDRAENAQKINFDADFFSKIHGNHEISAKNRKTGKKSQKII